MVDELHSHRRGLPFRALNRLGQTLRDILDAAHAIGTNFTWYEGRGEQISLLDTDFVCSALRYRSAERVLNADPGSSAGPSRGNDPGAEIEERTRTLLGAHTMRHIVNGLISGTPKQRYALPPGTQYELLRQVGPLKDSVAAQTRKLLARFEHALESPDPIRTLRDSGVIARMPDVVGPALEQFVTAYDDAELLKRVFANAEPVDKLLGDEPPAGIEQTYHSTRRLLDNLNPARSRNHTMDATNIALMVWMLGRPTLHDSPIPVLISSTRGLHLAGASLQEAVWLALDRAQHDDRVVAGGGGTLDGMLPRARTELSIVNSHFYLLIWQVLSRLGFGMQGAKQQAGALANSTNNLLHTLTQLSLALHKSKTSDRSLNATLRIFSLEFQEFLSEWEGVLGPIRHNAREDAVSSRNTLLSRDLLNFVTELDPQLSPRTVLERMNAVYRQLLELEQENAELQKLIIAGSDGPGAGSLEHFALSGHALSHSLPMLSEQRAGTGGVPEWQASDRVMVHYRFLPWEGALLVADYRAPSEGEPTLEFTWTHAADTRQIVLRIAESYDLLLAASAEEPFDTQVFFSRFVKREKLRGVDLSEWLADTLASAQCPDLVQVVRGHRALLFDVEPTARERRAQFQAPLGACDTSLCALIAALMGKTTAFSINDAYVARLLEHLVENFRGRWAKRRTDGGP